MLLDKVVLLNVALLITHQIDAAYWREWEMFGLPGGLQGFLFFNLAAFLFVLAFARRVFRRDSSGFAASLLISFLSALILPIHAGFALAGFRQFALPLSMAVIVLTFAAALAQVFLTLRAKGEFIGAGHTAAS